MSLLPGYVEMRTSLWKPAHFQISELEVRVADVFRMRQLQADVSGGASRIASVSNLLSVEHHYEVVAIDCGLDGVPLIRNNLDVVRRFAHVHDAAGEEISAAVIAGVPVADLQLVSRAAGIGRRFFSGRRRRPRRRAAKDDAGIDVRMRAEFHFQHEV